MTATMILASALWILVWGVFFISVAKILRGVSARLRTTQNRLPGAAFWITAAGVVFFGRLLILQPVASPLPWGEELVSNWNFVAATLEGRWDWRALTELVSEHRIVLTRLQTAALTAIGGGFDGYLTQVVNAAIYTFSYLILMLLLLAPIARANAGSALLAGVVLTMAGLLWLTYQNTAWGFQSHMYYVVIVTLLGIGLAVHGPLRPSTFVLLALLSVLSLGTMAAGFAGPVLAWSGLAIRCMLRPSSGTTPTWRFAATALLAAVGTTAGGLLLYASARSGNGSAAAAEGTRSIAEFSSAMFRNLAWPYVGTALLTPLIWWPLAWHAWRGTRTSGILKNQPAEVRNVHSNPDGPPDGAPASAMLLALYSLLMLGALSMARGTDAADHLRYSDFLLPGALGLCLLAFWPFVVDSRSATPRLRCPRIALSVMAGGIIISGLVLLSIKAATNDLPWWRKNLAIQADGLKAMFQHAQGLATIPDMSALQDAMRGILPPHNFERTLEIMAEPLYLDVAHPTMDGSTYQEQGPGRWALRAILNAGAGWAACLVLWIAATLRELGRLQTQDRRRNLCSPQTPTPR